MKLAGIQFPVFNPYATAAVEIYVSGCTRGCPFCHTPEMQDFNFGEELNTKNLLEYLKSRELFFDVISILGGDLLCQEEKKARSLALLLKECFSYKQFWLFTGENDQKNIPEWCFSVFDVIKYGSYKEELKTNGFPASCNQTVLCRGKEYE